MLASELKPMTLTLQNIFPNALSGLDNIGFIFGCGTSKCAGYPLTVELTKEVIGSLNTARTDYLEKILDAEGVKYDKKTGTPDIEQLSDIVLKHGIQNPSPEITTLENELRKKIVNCISSISEPKLDVHIKFFETLKSKFTGRESCIWIFTTNYDPLFELAAEKTRVRLLNGFHGIFNRYFDLNELYLSIGYLEGRNFRPDRNLSVILIKLHGSTSWLKENNNIFETAAEKAAKDRVLILPRRTKVIDTLEYPYDQLFRYSSRIIGLRCKYLASCGFSFRDQHIVESILLPKLQQKLVRIFAFFGEEPNHIDSLLKEPCFNYATRTKYVCDGKETTEKLDYWMFDKFVDLLSM